MATLIKVTDWLTVNLDKVISFSHDYIPDETSYIASIIITFNNMIPPKTFPCTYVEYINIMKNIHAQIAQLNNY